VAERLGSVVLEVDVDNRAALTGLERVKQSALSTGQELKTAFLAFQGAIAGTAIVATVKQIADLSIAAESAGVRLNSLAGRFGESTEAIATAAAAAKQLNLSQTEAANGFSQLYSALRPTGVSLAEIETIFVGVTAAAKNTGLSAESVNNALVQLTQGLASGRLQGDELRSVLEQLPPLSQAIARQLGVSVGSIKQLGSEGKITTDVIIRALNDLKRVELGQLDKSLTTSAERIKALGVAWENLQLSLAKEFSGVGDGLLTGLKAALDFLGSVSLSDTQQQIKEIEAGIATTVKLITDSKKYKLDTTDAENRLRELERRLQQLQSRPDIVTTDREQLYAQRLKILADIQRQEQEVFGQGATGLLLGSKDVSGRALLDGFDKAGAKGFEVLSGLQNQISDLQSQKIDLPFDATLQRERIDEQLAKLRKELEAKRGGLILDTQIEVSREALAELDRKLKQGSGEAGLATERDQLRLQIEQLLEARRNLGAAVASTGAKPPVVDSDELQKAVAAGKEAIADARQQYFEVDKLSKLKGDARTVAAEQLKIEKALAAEAKAYVESYQAKQGQDPVRAQKLEDAAAVASLNLRTAMVEGSKAIEEAAKNARRDFEAAKDFLTSALDGQNRARVSAFDLLPDFAQAETRSRLIAQIQGGVAGGFLDSGKISQLYGPDLGRIDIGRLADLAGKSTSLVDANNGVINANKALQTATENLNATNQQLLKTDRRISVTVNADTGQSFVNQAAALQS
jgi:tape measure domain-containing protein